MSNKTVIRSQWSISSGSTESGPLTSQSCYNSLEEFFQNDSPYLLAVTTESSSHPTGTASLFGQPWVYAGGGLGNLDSCSMQVCLAGGTQRDSLTFASVCIVPECDASDLAAVDFTQKLEKASTLTDTSKENLAHEYVTLHERIAEVNKLLQTGWVCGEFKVEWETVPSLVYGGAMTICFILSIIGTFYKRRRPRKPEQIWEENLAPLSDDEEEKKDTYGRDMPSPTMGSPPPLENSPFWSAWDMSEHLKKLCEQRPDTAFLDGLKFWSILWVISGHVMAIQSSTGPGYLNPGDFLPPVGITTTFLGQLLFSARFAVDTFLAISGFLVVHVLKRKLHYPPKLSSIIQVLAFRILRILPLYAACLGFWMYIAPHLASGPFWYQWENFLEPCRKYWWTNLLFVNNFLPWATPTTDTCLYHSWYLAVDVQLFFLFAPWLVILYGRSKSFARKTTFALWLASVFVTALLAYERKWSVNTCDGLAVARFDIEGYAKPHIRAQSYLAGMLVAMMAPTRPRPRRDAIYMVLCLLGLAFVSFITVTGAYSRRACTFGESPLTAECGSTWPTEVTFLYTAFSRALWSICVSVLLFLCVEQRGHAIGAFLSWRLWTPLAQLSFGAYLIHPILIFIWQLSGKEKITFRVLSFFMDFTSISVVSFFLSAVLTLTVEFPFGTLLKPKSRTTNIELRTLLPTLENVRFHQYTSYGATLGKDGYPA